MLAVKYYKSSITLPLAHCTSIDEAHEQVKLLLQRGRCCVIFLRMPKSMINFLGLNWTLTSLCHLFYDHNSFKIGKLDKQCLSHYHTQWHVYILGFLHQCGERSRRTTCQDGRAGQIRDFYVSRFKNSLLEYDFQPGMYLIGSWRCRTRLSRPPSQKSGGGHHKTDKARQNPLLRLVFVFPQNLGRISANSLWLTEVFRLWLCVLCWIAC